MTAKVSEQLKEIGLFSSEEIAILSKQEQAEIIEEGILAEQELNAVVRQSIQIQRLERMLLGLVTVGHFIFVEAEIAAENPPDWPFRVVEDPQAAYPQISERIQCAKKMLVKA
ncbi:MAG TPA: hypothetical protein ENJ82_15615 [Bacteroidetes bacterium]|nr:hypothetical protein [Bacteroidota bacterium]